jgi:hypothetical protein
MVRRSYYDLGSISSFVAQPSFITYSAKLRFRFCFLLPMRRRLLRART